MNQKTVRLNLSILRLSFLINAVKMTENITIVNNMSSTLTAIVDPGILKRFILGRTGIKKRRNSRRRLLLDNETNKTNAHAAIKIAMMPKKYTSRAMARHKANMRPKKKYPGILFSKLKYFPAFLNICIMSPINDHPLKKSVKFVNSYIPVKFFCRL